MADVTQIGHWINGARVAGESGREGDVFNPATGQVTGRVALASPGELDTAVAAARAALPGWRDTGLTKRTAVMFKLREIITARSDGKRPPYAWFVAWANDPKVAVAVFVQDGESGSATAGPLLESFLAGAR